MVNEKMMKKNLIGLCVCILSLIITTIMFISFKEMNWFNSSYGTNIFQTLKFLLFFLPMTFLLFGVTNFKNNKSKKIWKIAFGVSFIPFAFVIILGIYFMINGFSGFCFCDNYYGFKAFIDSVVLFSYIFIPIYIISILLMILSIIKLNKLL